MAAKKGVPVDEKPVRKGKKPEAAIAAKAAPQKPLKKTPPPLETKASGKKKKAASLEAEATVLVGEDVMPELKKTAPEAAVVESESAVKTPVKSKKKRSAAAEEVAPPTPEVIEAPEPEAAPKRKKKAAKSLEAEATAVIAAEVAPEISAPPEPQAESKPKRKGRKKKDAVEEAGAQEAAPVVDESSTTPAASQESAPQPAAEETQSETGADESGEEKESGKAEANPEEIMRTIEALLFAAEEPIAVREIARAAGSDSPTVRKLLPKLIEAYDKQRRPWTIMEVGEGYRLMTRPEFFPAIQRLKTQTLQRRLTQAALETLALIAYRQPIGRAEVESVRGVGAGPVIRILLEKKLIKISGRGTGLGQPLLYGTTDYFLEHFGLKSIADLPKPGEFKGS